MELIPYDGFVIFPRSCVSSASTKRQFPLESIVDSAEQYDRNDRNDTSLSPDFSGAPMQLLRLAVATRCWKEPLPRLLTEISELGVEGLQIDLRDEVPPASLTESGRRDFLHRLREKGLQLASAWLPLRQPLYSESEMDGRVEYVRKALEFAAQLRIPTLCLRVGKVPEDLAEGSGKILREILDDLAAVANHRGVTLALTPTAESATELGQLVRTIKKGPVGIDFDPAYFAMAALPVAETLKQLHGEVVHFQLRDGLREIAGGGIETELGQGTVDWREVVALLGEMDYRGWCTALRTQGDDKPGDIARGIAALKRLLLST